LVTVKTIGKNQHGVVICDFIRTMLIPKTGHAVDDKANY
ncbi:MAG: MaoC family dehydratase, partial [Porticoccaceae bacterium]